MTTRFYCPPIEAGCPADLDGPLSPDGLRNDGSAGDNGVRASWAAVAVKAYAKQTGLLRGESCDTAIRDLLSDLMHLADGLRQTDSLDPFYPDFDAMLASAQARYEEEIRGEI